MSTPRANVPQRGEEFGRRIADRYRIVRKIGQGGMGSVYEAEHELLGRRVALKTLSADRVRGENATARFQREARAAAAIECPNVVEVFDFGTDDDGSPFLVMELLNGEDLSKRLAREPQLAITRAIEIARQTCTALTAAHALGIVHRDIKPENLFLCERTGDDELVKVLDFGIARIDRSADAPTVTTTGSITGTPRYLAPEQIEGFAVDGRADVYALAVVLYRMLAGIEPFRGPTHHMLLLRILADDPPSLRRLRPDVSDELESVIFHALAKRPDDRFESAAAFAEALALVAPDVRSEPARDDVPLVETTLRVSPSRRGGTRTVAPYVRRRLPKHAWVVAWPLLAAAVASGFRVARLTRPATLRPVVARRGTGGSSPPVASLALAEAARSVVVELRILPECASVTIDGQPVANPSTIRRPLSTRPVKLRASCPNMATLDAELVFDHDQRIALELPLGISSGSHAVFTASATNATTLARRAHPIVDARVRSESLLEGSPSRVGSPATEQSPAPTPERSETPEEAGGFLDEF